MGWQVLFIILTVIKMMMMMMITTGFIHSKLPNRLIIPLFMHFLVAQVNHLSHFITILTITILHHIIIPCCLNLFLIAIPFPQSYHLIVIIIYLHLHHLIVSLPIPTLIKVAIVFYITYPISHFVILF